MGWGLGEKSRDVCQVDVWMECLDKRSVNKRDDFKVSISG